MDRNKLIIMSLKKIEYTHIYTYVSLTHIHTDIYLQILVFCLFKRQGLYRALADLELTM